MGATLPMYNNHDIWHQRTDGRSICTDCTFNGHCKIQNRSTTTGIMVCNYYEGNESLTAKEQAIEAVLKEVLK